MSRLLADENFPRSVVFALRALGHDVETIQERGLTGIPDMEILQLANLDSRAILTINRRDFARLHLQGLQHAGMILCTYDPDTAALVDRIHQAIESHDTLNGVAIRIVKPNPPQHPSNP